MTAPRTIIFIALTLSLGSCGKKPNLLEQIKAVGVLRVATTNSPTTYYFGPDGQSGFEYELARLFADELGVSLKLIIPPTGAVLPLVQTGKAHIAAAGVTVTNERKDRVRFGPTYKIVSQQLVYRRGTRKPTEIADLVGKTIEVSVASSYAERLRELHKQNGALVWSEREDTDIEELLEAVWEQTIDHTVADSHILAQLRRLYPELAPAFEIAHPQALAWAMSMSDDNSLVEAVAAFFSKLRASGELDRLSDRHFGLGTSFDYVNARAFLRQAEARLPEYRPVFERAAADYGMDWQLLAALAYQESHWQPLARSPTGVRGMMMLTRATAKRLNVENRLDATASIDGGSRYLRDIKRRLPDRIPEPDRTWLALAAYNVGLGHLEDARVLTERQGGNPDRWIDVRNRLPLLARKQWYSQTRYGYARGAEPVRFVQNIRRYFDVLQWLTQAKTAEQAPIFESLNIDSPVL